MEASVEQFKERARAAWSAGNFDEIAKTTRDVGRKVAATGTIEPGMTVLDVACGSGNSAIPAALAGARVTGLDLVAHLLETARKYADEAGVQVDWVEGDAEALPFADAGFQRVQSMFGVMFAPRHAVAAGELARVCAPGGTLVITAWTPEGIIGRMFTLVASRMPPAPSYASPPPLWGSEDHVRELLEPHGFEIQTEKAMAVFRGKTVEDVVDTMETYFGPWMMAKAALGEDWASLRAELYDVYASTSRPMDDGGVGSFGEYLLVTARKTA